MQAAQVSRPIFREVQRFNQIWIWLTVVALAAVFWRLAFKHFFHWPPALPPLREWALLFFWLLFGIFLPGFISLCRLITEVRDDGIYFRVLPFHREFKKLPFQDFKRYEMLVYRRIGWGVHYGNKGRAYNISGDRGLEFTFHDGRQLLIGSQKVREFLHAIHMQCGGNRGPGTTGGRK